MLDDDYIYKYIVPGDPGGNDSATTPTTGEGHLQE